MIGEHPFADDVVLVEAAIHRCGCATATTHAGYPAEARFCPAGLRLAEDLARARDALRTVKCAGARGGGRPTTGGQRRWERQDGERTRGGW